MVLRQLLSLSPDRIYTVEDLADNELLDRALRLLYRARFGQSNGYSRISPHIRYDKLQPDIVSGIKDKLKLQDGEYQCLIRTAQDGKADKGHVYSYRYEIAPYDRVLIMTII